MMGKRKNLGTQFPQRTAVQIGPLQQSLAAKQVLGVTAEDARFVGLGDRQATDARQHLLQAPDLMRVIASRKDVTGAGELDCQPQRSGVEIYRVIIKPLQVNRGGLRDILAAFTKSVIAAIEALRQIRDRTAQVS